MNLRARNLGLIILSALTLFSCEEELSTIGLPPENNLGIFFADIPLGDKATQVWVDEVRSGNTGILLAGKYMDPDLGPIEAKNFSEVLLPAGIKFDTLLANATFDSLVYSLRVGGVTGLNFENQTQVFEIYQLQDTIADQRAVNGAFTSSTQELASKVGERQLVVYPDSINLSFSDSDFSLDTKADSVFKDKFFDSNETYIYRHNIKLNNTFGQNFFNQARSGVNFDSVTNFAEYFKGLAIVSSINNSAIIQYLAANSLMTLHYTKNGVSKSIPFIVSTSRSYNNISPNVNEPWMAGALTGISPYVPYETNGNEVFLHSGTNLLLKLELSGLRQFEDTLGSAIIQSAELRLGINSVSSFLEPSSPISMGLTSLDSLGNENYYIDPLVNNQGANRIPFDKNFPGYITNIPLFIENLSSNDLEFDQIILFQGVSDDGEAFLVNSEVKKVIINKDQLKLRIYYTIPDKK